MIIKWWPLFLSAGQQWLHWHSRLALMSDMSSSSVWTICWITQTAMQLKQQWRLVIIISGLNVSITGCAHIQSRCLLNVNSCGRLFDYCCSTFKTHDVLSNGQLSKRTVQCHRTMKPSFSFHSEIVHHYRNVGNKHGMLSQFLKEGIIWKRSSEFLTLKSWERIEKTEITWFQFQTLNQFY